MSHKPTEYGSGIVVKELDDKILICADSRTHLKEGNFLLNAEVIHIKSGPGIKISSEGTDTLVISANLTPLEEKIFDLKEDVDSRLINIERAFKLILKPVKKE